MAALEHANVLKSRSELYLDGAATQLILPWPKSTIANSFPISGFGPGYLDHVSKHR